MTTYLCGGINGLSDTDCRDWRTAAKALLDGETLDPMRRDYRGREDDSVREIVEGDIADIRASDVVLVNAIRPSWGTAMEVFFAHSIGKPVIAWSGDARISPWLRYHCVEIHPALGAAVDAVNRRWVPARV
jgi:nucleoside 2-deoxyribosyltransferase